MQRQIFSYSGFLQNTCQFACHHDVKAFAARTGSTASPPMASAPIDSRKRRRNSRAAAIILIGKFFSRTSLTVSSILGMVVVINADRPIIHALVFNGASNYLLGRHIACRHPPLQSHGCPRSSETMFLPISWISRPQPWPSATITGRSAFPVLFKQWGQLVHGFLHCFRRTNQLGQKYSRVS